MRHGQFSDRSRERFHLESFKQALRRLPKAVAVITSANENGRYAMSATAVCEVSLYPPTMLICVNKEASIYPSLAIGDAFAINFLHHCQEPIALGCAGRLKGEDRFSVGDWTASDSGAPVLLDAQANIICECGRIIEHGTHGIIFGTVTEVHINGAPDPLLYLDGGFARVQESSILGK